MRDHALTGVAQVPAVPVQVGPLATCSDPTCGLFAADARRFHADSVPPTGLRRWSGSTAMMLDLALYPSADTYVKAVSKRSRGNVPRAAKKAARLGITCARINPDGHVASLAAIRGSKRFRSGGPVLAAWFGGRAPGEDTCVAPEAPACPDHWTLVWGAFLETSGGPRLIAYLALRRVGDLCRTFDLMAHGDHLGTGVMKLLFLEVARWLLERQDREAQGVRWLMYGAMEHGAPGLHEWKRLLCFTPAHLLFEDVPAAPPSRAA
ncbi:hypothetical protein GCM10007301_46360 [Azorhizobium oxalatiphilum]|uniref:Uncharacterized protein n=1 Tax=Azorhizobium oxalatiphilum TaxID=980631 RepID=A0A917CB80_9HYPH|nr:hypothetical protein [Azorhizobium oxalatiphilum]GGF80985.1 hypothetical protein GCM10007301_46360 [Azorhizobium oxalatiphilum]